jgi:Ca-activated chloride channel family protein
MKRIDPRLRIAAILLLATVAAGAAARLGAREAAATSASAALPQQFRAPGGGTVHFAGALEGTAVLPQSDPLVRMELRIGADAPQGAAPPRVATDLVVVLDRSGSMTGDKIEHARAAVRGLIGGLGASDRFALVTYSDGAHVPIPLAVAGSHERERWLAIVDAIHPDGGTAMSSGLDVALDMFRVPVPGRAPRIVLISDGLANQGDSSREGLVARASRAPRGEYALSTVGVGADFDEGLMAALADAGAGNFHFLADATGLDRILQDEFATARETVATGLRVAIEPPAGVTVVDAAGYPLARDGAIVSFVPGGELFAGQERRIWVTLRVPADASGVVSLGKFAVEYRAGGERRRLALDAEPRVAAVADETDYFASLDTASWERSVVVDQYNALRRSVATAVKEGREKDAVAEVQRYRDAIAKKNEKVQSPKVAEQLAEAERLEQRMQDAASGVAPMAPLETKQLRSLGYVEGRAGARR